LTDELPSPEATPRLRSHPRASLTPWICPHCGTRQELDPREDVKRLVDTLPPSLDDRSPARRARPQAVPTLELVAKRCRRRDCASVAITASLGTISPGDASRANGHGAAFAHARVRGQDDSTFHLTPEASRAPLPADLPEPIRRDVREARAIAAPSPRAAAALYRRALKAMLADRADEPDGLMPAVRAALDAVGDDPFAEIATSELAELARLVDRMATACYGDSTA